MRVLLALVLVLAVAAANSPLPSPRSMEVDQELFSKFAQQYNKNYELAEVGRRFETFRANLDLIQRHNAEYERGVHTHWLSVNEYADMTNDEFRAQFNNYRHWNRSQHNVLYAPSSTADLPTEVDWRQKGVVTSVKNQGQCGSCWSFSACGSMEGLHALQTGEAVSLSEQQLVDCVNGGANTCNRGGLMDQAFEYVINAPGIESDADYPYMSGGGQSGFPCKFDASKVAAKISGYQDVQSGSEDALAAAVAGHPTVSVAINAGEPSFQFYSGGVYAPSSCPANLDHGVLAVGYGSDSSSGKDYWIVKNSWGPNWGLSGYIWMARNAGNLCGIATAASYPTGQ